MEQKMTEVKIGDVISSDSGIGKIMAITQLWVIHEIEDGDREVAVYRPTDRMWIDVTFGSGILKVDK
jgi:hypothetical protein